MSDDQQDAIAEAIRDAAQLILAGLCAIGEAIHESREEPEPENTKPPVRECVEVKKAPGFGGLCTSTACLDPPAAARYLALDNSGDTWHLCTGCVEHMRQRGYEISVAKRKGIPSKPDVTSLVRLRRRQETS